MSFTIVIVEIKGNQDDQRLGLATEQLRAYKRQIDGENGNPFLKSGIRRGLAVQGYEVDDTGEPSFRITSISFNSVSVI